MECLIQYLDEIEDFFYAIALLAERIRRLFRVTLILASSALLTTGGVTLALSRPPLALAVVTLALAGLLYHAAVDSPHRPAVR
jgi:hypothetical protein